MIKNLFVEGPDCAGKTTLIEAIHKKTNYRYHIQDRSQISRHMFASLYERDIPNLEDDLRSELLNLNNVYIILLPPWTEILERFKQRGDEKHDKESLRDVYDLFYSNTLNKFCKLPNVHVVFETERDNVLSSCLMFLEKYQDSNIKSLARKAWALSQECKNKEAVNLRFEFFPHKSFPNANYSIVYHEKEGEYYQKIYKKLFEKIKSELNGDNEYSRKETESSRRFIYTDDTCISLIHIMIRNETLRFNCVIRSSNVKDVLPYDVEFLYFLCSCIKQDFFNDIDKIHMRFELNSSHILC